ncbi:MAG: glycosyltransferase family 87 protein [Candidatus Aminicenantales bacterium]
MGKKVLLLSVVLGFFLLMALFLLKAKEEMVDFEVNYKAGERIRMGETLYRAEDEHYQFKYSPFSAIFYIPLSYLPLPWAKGIWYFLILCSLGLIIFLAERVLNPVRETSSFFIFLSVLVLFRYFLRELHLGQINALLTFLLTGMIWFIQEENSPSLSKDVPAGLLWGLATALKPYAVIFIPYFILRKKWLVLGTGLLFIAVSLCLPSLYYGFSGNITVHKEWISSLSRSTPILLDSQDNISLMAFFMKWTGDLKLTSVLYIISTAVLAVIILLVISRGKRMSRPFPLEASFLLVVIPLLSPLGWDYTLFSSILGVAIVLKYFSRFPGALRIVLLVNFLIIALSLYDILGKNFYARFMSWSIITINFLILAGSLVYLRMKDTC